MICSVLSTQHIAQRAPTRSTREEDTMAMAVGARPIKAPGWSGGAHTDLALVDCDVHQTVEKMDLLIPYLSRVYAQQAHEQGIRLAGSGYFNVANDAARTDLAANGNCDLPGHDGRQMGTTYERLREQHLDLWNVDKVLLTGASTYGASILPDPDFAASLCSAFNDWTIEHWLEKDELLLM